MDDITASNPHLVGLIGPPNADSPRDDSASDFYPDSPAKKEDENNNPQPPVPQESSATLSHPSATRNPSSAATVASLTGVASPESDVSSFDDVYNEASAPTDGDAAAGLLQDQIVPQETKPNGMSDADETGERFEIDISVAGSSEPQALGGAGDVQTASAPDADHGVAGAAVDAPRNSASHDSPLSSDSSDTSTEEGEDSDADAPLLSAAEQAKILMAEATEHIDEAPVVQFTKPDVTVTPDMAITELGTVEKLVELQALVRANTSGSYRVLDTGSVLCLQNRTVIGSVFDIVGRVHEPAYTFGFASEQDLKDSGITVGTPVYYVDAHSTYVFTQPLQLAKGTDASNVHDEEGSEAEPVFSDDEMEADYKRELGMAKQHGPQGPAANAGSATSPPTGPSRSRRGGGRNKRQRLDAPRNSGPSAMDAGHNDLGDAAFAEGYQPLRRPDNLTDLMQRGPQPGIERGPQPNMSRRSRGRREKREKKREMNRREANQRGQNRPGRFDQGFRGGYGQNGNTDQRESRDGYRRGQAMQDQRSGSGYGINSAPSQSQQPFPSSPGSAQSASQADPAPDMGRYRQGQYSSYSASSPSSPFVPGGQYSQNYTQTSGYGQSYQAPDQQYSGRTWHQNQDARAGGSEYTPSFSHAQTAASNPAVQAPSVPDPQQLASALGFGSGLLNPHAVNILGALQQAQAAGFSPLQTPHVQTPQVPAPQAQQPQQSGTAAAEHVQDIASILERFKQQSQRFHDSYR
jgi:H/ACA ribonucleoprotein complex non-core subunit NAF1